MNTDCIVHIIDDDEAVRNSLVFLLSVAGFPVRVHASATDFLAESPSTRQGCLLTDLRMPDMTGVDLLKRLKADREMIPSIVITGHGDVPMAVEAMKAGALDFIEKPFENAVLIDAIARATDTARTGRAESAVADGAIDARLATLTRRELEVFQAVVSGLPNKTIAHDLSISPRTVEVHRANVMAKMQAQNLADLVRIALASGHAVDVRRPDAMGEFR